MSEALPVLCGNHNYLPSPESNHHTDFYRNRFLLFFVVLSAKCHPWTLQFSYVHTISQLKSLGHLTCRVSCSLDDASCILLMQFSMFPCPSYFMQTGSWIWRMGWCRQNKAVFLPFCAVIIKFFVQLYYWSFLSGLQSSPGCLYWWIAVELLIFVGGWRLGSLTMLSWWPHFQMCVVLRY